jgi:hypothetical protein
MDFAAGDAIESVGEELTDETWSYRAPRPEAAPG